MHSKQEENLKMEAMQKTHVETLVISHTKNLEGHHDNGEGTPNGNTTVYERKLKKKRTHIIPLDEESDGAA